MVMEQPPSIPGPPSISGGPSSAPVDAMRPQPQASAISARSVGTEFVRQYYTLLNNAPLHLHRFYSNQSSFVHSGHGEEKEAEPVYGQQAIHQKIKQLNFRECHAKIKHVDAHPTHGSGVVVQVCGELANDNQGYRKFMQTFVLVLQGPNKYYLHNDIFRYQDEFWPLDGNDGEQGHANGAESATNKFNSNNTLAAAAANVPNTLKNEPPMTNGGNRNDFVESNHLAKTNPPTLIHAEPAKSTPPSVSVKEIDEAIAAPLQQPDALMTEDTLVEDSSSYKTKESNTKNVANGSSESNVVNVTEEVAVEAPTDAPQVVQENQIPVEQTSVPETITYATLVKAGQTANAVTSKQPINNNLGSSKSATTTNKDTASTIPGKDSTASTTPLVSQRGGFSGRGGAPPVAGRGGPVGGGGRGQGRERFGLNPLGTSTNFSNGNITNNVSKGGAEQYDTFEDRRRGNNTLGSSPYPDTHQLFVGNLPHNCTEPQLESLFSKFGVVADIRINNKGQQQTKTTMSGARVPNFGFVIFEEERSAQACLKSLPLCLPENNHRLNVEEKKNKGRFDNTFINKTGGQEQPYGRGTLGRGASDRGRGGASVRGIGNRGGVSSGQQQQQQVPFRRKSPFNNGQTSN